ncbi:hypothetical protein FRB96_007914 [Tulasnella sp. 330]|nr:hypothetical protein FRB96_007914 [Tulasnella sp. 330]
MPSNHLASEQVFRAISNATYSPSPIAKLPVELLVRILILVLGDPFGQEYRRTLIQLMQVAPAWYDAASGYPGFWTTLVGPVQEEELSRVLKRCGSQLLDVVLRNRGGEFDELWKQETAFYRAVIRAVSRWRSASIECHNLLPLDFDQLQYHPAPELKQFTLVILTDYQTRTETRHVKNLFRGVTPKLRDLELSGVNVPWPSRIFSGLQRLSLSYLHESTGAQQVFGILQNASQLISLKLSFLGRQMETVEEAGTGSGLVALSDLETLYLDQVSKAVQNCVMTRFETPRCREWDVSGTHVLPRISRSLGSLPTNLGKALREPGSHLHITAQSRQTTIIVSLARSMTPLISAALPSRHYRHGFVILEHPEMLEILADHPLSFTLEGHDLTRAVSHALGPLRRLTSMDELEICGAMRSRDVGSVIEMLLERQSTGVGSWIHWNLSKIRLVNCITPENKESWREHLTRLIRERGCGRIGEPLVGSICSVTILGGAGDTCEGILQGLEGVSTDKGVVTWERR